MSIIDKYCAYLLANGKSKHTINGAKSVLRNFALNVENLSFVTQDNIIDFISNKKYKEMTRLTSFDTFKSFYNWMESSNQILFNPMTKLKRPKKPRLLPSKVMGLTETKRLLEAIPLDETNHKKYRDRVILELMYTASLRRSEIVRLNLNDFEPSSRSLRINHSKNGKGRVIPIGEFCAQILGKYIDKIRLKCESEALFVSFFKKRLHSDYITSLVWRLRREVKIRTKASSHSFRKSSATHMLKNGAPLRTVQALLGHSCIDSTQFYAKVYPRDIEKMLKSKHPRWKEKNQMMPKLEVPKMVYHNFPFK